MPKSFLPRKSHITDGNDCETDEEEPNEAGEEAGAAALMKLQKDSKNAAALPRTQTPAQEISVMEVQGSEVKVIDPGPSLNRTPRCGELIDHPYMSTDQEQNKKVQTIIKNTDETTKSFTCVFCYKTFSHRYILNRHLPVHTDDRKYGCTVCGKMFRQASTLCRHKVVHTNEKRFTCKSCDKSFNRVSTLIAHEKIHIGDKAYVCPTCGKGFHQKGNLKNHIFTHTGEKPYVCKVESCGKSFNQLSNLSMHMTMKHKEKVCDICDEGFKTLAEVKAHKAASHKESRCSICDMSFKTQAELMAHEQEKHLIMHVQVAPLSGGGVTNNSEQTVIEGGVVGKEQVALLRVGGGVGRAVNDPHCRTVTLPNGDKTIIPLKQKQNATGLDCWYDMDDGVRAAASILMELESSSGIQSSKVGQETVVVEHMNIERPEPACSQNNMEIHLVDTGTNTGESDAVQAQTVTDNVEIDTTLSSVLTAGLYKIGTADDGQVMALLVKADGTCTLVKVAQNGPTLPDSQAPEKLTSLLVSSAASVEQTVISVDSNITPQYQPTISSQLDTSEVGKDKSVICPPPGSSVTNSLDSIV